MVAHQVNVSEEDALDVSFWMSQNPASRLAEVFRLRKNHFTWINGSFPKRMEKIISQRQISLRN